MIVHGSNVRAGSSLTVRSKVRCAAIRPISSVPALASFAIFQFLWVWNDLLVGLTFASSEQWPMTAALSDKASANWGQNQHLLTAGAFISMIVPLVVFFSLQKYFVRGLLAGSVKG